MKTEEGVEVEGKHSNVMQNIFKSMRMPEVVHNSHSEQDSKPPKKAVSFYYKGM